MKKGKGEKEYTFAFEEFIAINEIDVKDLPDYIQTMIRTISKQRVESKQKCTQAHYRIIKGKLQKFADIVEDYLMNHFDDRLANNVIEEPDEKEEKPLSIEQKKAQSTIALAEQFGRNYLLSSELKSLDIEVDYSEKEIVIDEVRLERELGTARWYLGINPNYKEMRP
jgi:hypothetical protein